MKIALASFAIAFNIIISCLEPTFANLIYTNMTKEALVASLVDLSSGIEITGITASSHIDKCSRYYTGGHSLGFAYENDDGTTTTNIRLLPDQGIVLSSGDPEELERNNDDGTDTNWSSNLGFGALSDADLEQATGQTEPSYDACFIQFDFKCTVGSTVSFNYLFGSDEYTEYVDDEFNDAFAFILNGENIAKLPSTETPTDVVSINNVNAAVNRQYFHLNDPDDPNDVYPQFEPDGFTVILTAVGTLNETNSIKIVIADVSDERFDSWVLLERGTFACGTTDSSKSGKADYSKSGKSKRSTKSAKNAITR
mmetsp:Transcript_3003/g.4611  ORF Transcript_3003/g.4611 Transcript_3003/m.4611 type:complete len:311 (+) Transcript_3003:106-1038(+)